MSCTPSPCCGGSMPAGSTTRPPLPASGERFRNMIPHALAAAQAHHAAGRPVVGISCEYTPREIILAAGGLPVCLCGGSAAMATRGEEQLPANLCPLIKSTYGYHLSGGNPFLELADLIVAETTCDGKKKMFERMAETRAMHVLELPQKINAPGAETRWLEELRTLVAVLEARYHTTITDAALREAIRTMNRERVLRRRLAETLRACRPPLTGRELLDLKSIISGLDDDLAAYENLLDELNERPSPIGDTQPVRVLLTGVPLPHGAERVLELIEDHGALVVCQENCTGLKPLLDPVIDPEAADPLAAIAAHYLHLPCSVMTPNDARLSQLAALARDYRAECIVELVWQACLTYDCEAWRVEDLSSSLGLPYLRITTDYQSGDSARIAVRIEALAETVRAGRSNA